MSVYVQYKHNFFPRILIHSRLNPQMQNHGYEQLTVVRFPTLPYYQESPCDTVLINEIYADIYQLYKPHSFPPFPRLYDQSCNRHLSMKQSPRKKMSTAVAAAYFQADYNEEKTGVHLFKVIVSLVFIICKYLKHISPREKQGGQWGK